jgi:hypothetical protein
MARLFALGLVEGSGACDGGGCAGVMGQNVTSE